MEDIETAAGEHSELTCYEDFVNVLIMALTDDKNSQYEPEEQQYKPELGEEVHGYDKRNEDGGPAFGDVEDFPATMWG